MMNFAPDLSTPLFKEVKGYLSDFRAGSNLPSNPIAALTGILCNVLDKPHIVEFETVNVCNSKCIFCISRNITRKKELIDKNLFESCILQISKLGASQLCLAPMLGDPLLDDHVISHAEFIHKTENMGVLRLVTNGLAFDKYDDDQLLRLFNAIDVLGISVGPNDYVYRTMFGVDRFDHLIRQLERVCGIIEKMSDRLNNITLCGRASGSDFWVDPRLSEISARLTGTKNISWTREYMDWGGLIQNLPLETPVIKINMTNSCVAPCYYALCPHIYHDGKVGLCACAGASESLIIGDLNSQSWLDILRSDTRLLMILSFCSGLLPEYCSKCSFYKPASKIIDWEPLINFANNGYNNLRSDSKDIQGLSKASVNVRNALINQYFTRAKGILHLGGHKGQERHYYSKLGKSVIWVEALPHIHTKLRTNIEPFPNQQALCALIGDKDGNQTVFHISNNAAGGGSSIFPYGKHGSGDKSLWPDLKLKMVDSITLPMTRLDTLLTANNISSEDYDFWVIDLQGAELLALKGAGALLKKCIALHIEISTVDVYQGGVLWPELGKWLDEAGFINLWEPDYEHDKVLFVRKSVSNDALSIFHSDHYQRHNQRRLEHLASLGLDLHNKSVLETGAGVGDHTSFYLDRECSVVAIEIRPENLHIMHKKFSKYKNLKIFPMDMDNPKDIDIQEFDIVHCYGLLYHLSKPEQALEFMSRHCKGIMLLETCVSYGSNPEINFVKEYSHKHSQSFFGQGCRPTRTWVWNVLSGLFEHVYTTRTQPAHEEFPLDWTIPDPNPKLLKRSVFVASRHPLQSPYLANELVLKHTTV